MANEPDNLVLVQLREIRNELKKLEKLDAMEKRFDKRFDDLDTKYEQWRGYVTHALGLGSVNQLRNDSLDGRLDAEIKERARLAEQVAALDRRVTRIEEQPTT